MQVFSSMTIMPPEPIIEPISASFPKPTLMSKNFLGMGMQPPEGPPVCTALSSFLLGMPPPMP